MGRIAVIVVVVVVVVLALGWAWTRRPPKISHDADRFTAARTMTNHWANDPNSAPKGVLDMAKGRSIPVQADGETADGGERNREPRAQSPDRSSH